MKTILIPTDFSPESLQLVEYAILNYPDSKLDIILLSGYRMPESRWGITHFNPQEQIGKQVNSQFMTTKRNLILENRDSINTISIELFTGVNSYAFQNLLEKIEVEDAIIPKVNSLKNYSSKCFDTIRFIKKNVKNVTEVPVEYSDEVAERKFSLVSLLNL